MTATQTAKAALLQEFAELRATDWIESGDRKEEQRNETVSQLVKINRKMTIKQLRLKIEITRLRQESGTKIRVSSENKKVASVNSGPRLVTASRFELARLQEKAWENGKAFASQKIGASCYRVMEIPC